MKKYLILLLLLAVLPAQAQDYKEWRKKYDRFKEQRDREYRDFKARANADFVEFLKRQWKRCEPRNADAAPLPVIPAEPAGLPPAHPARRPLPDPAPDPKAARIVDGAAGISSGRLQAMTPAERRGERLDMDFYGDTLNIPWPEAMSPRLVSTDERGFSAVWAAWSRHGEPCVRYLGDYADSRRLNGWGYYRLVCRVSERVYDDRMPDERIALQAFLLSQLRFKAQVAVCGERLVLLLPFEEQVYSVPYIMIDNRKHYIYSYGHNRRAGYRTYENNFSCADRLLSLSVDGRMEVGMKDRMEIGRWSAILGEPLEVCMPLGNIALMRDYPIVGGEVFYRQGVTSELAGQILATLRRKITGMSETQQVGYLLNLVQNGFGYATDNEMFGRQKQLFIEESFFYGRNNCKDRVGVFSWLVRELTGLDMITVSYDATSRSRGVAHIACAVCFKGDVPGDGFTYRGRRYVMCDPTYINAGIGRTMPCYEGDAGEIRPLE